MMGKIRAQVEALYPEMLKTLQFITGIDRGSKNVAGLSRMADYLEEAMRGLGCEIERYENDEYGPTVVGRKKGKGKAVVFLYAHMDTVWPQGTCAQRPFRVENGFAYGPGVSDCAHGILGQLYALQTLAALGIDGFGELIVLFNPDEELYSPQSAQHIAKYARLADVAFCMEGPDKGDEYISSRGGVLFYDIEVTGVKSHAGVMPQNGRNAIEELCHKITLVHAMDIPGAYPHTTLIRGGISEGMVPDYAWAHVDVRVDSFEAINAVADAMARIEGDTLIEGTRTACVHRKGGCLPLVKTPEADKFCRLIDEVSQEADYPLHEAFCGGGANAVISALENVPTLDGLSPMTYDCHTNNERMELASIVPRVAILTEVIRRVGLDDRYLRKR